MGVSVDFNDLEKVYDILDDTNRLIFDVNDKIEDIRKKTNSNIRLNSQKIVISDSINEKDESRRIKENFEDAKSSLNGNLFGDAFSSAALALGTLVTTASNSFNNNLFNNDSNTIIGNNEEHPDNSSTISSLENLNVNAGVDNSYSNNQVDEVEILDGGNSSTNTSNSEVNKSTSLKDPSIYGSNVPYSNNVTDPLGILSSGSNNSIVDSNQNNNQQHYAFDGNWNYDNNNQSQSSNSYWDRYGHHAISSNYSNNSTVIATMSQKDFVTYVDSRNDLTVEIKNYLKMHFEIGNKRAVALQLVISELDGERIKEEQTLRDLENQRDEFEASFYDNNGIDVSSLLQTRDSVNEDLANARAHLETVQVQIDLDNEMGIDSSITGNQAEYDNIQRQIDGYELRLEELNADLSDYDLLTQKINEQENVIYGLNQQIFQYEQSKAKWEYDYLGNIRDTNEYKSNLNFNDFSDNPFIFDKNTYSLNFGDLANSSYSDTDIFLIMYYRYNSEEYKNWFLENNQGLEFTRENLVNDFTGAWYGNSMNELKMRSFIYMSEDQLNDYLYIYNTDGKIAAEKYLSAFEPDINSALGWDMTLEALDRIDSVDSLFIELGITLGEGVQDGAMGYFNNLATIFNRNTTMTPTEYKSMNLAQIFLMANMYLEVDDDTLSTMYKKGEISEETYNKLLKKDHITKLDIDLENGDITQDMYNGFQNALNTDTGLNNLITHLKDHGTTFNYTYQIGSNMGNMMPSMAISVMTGGAGWASNLSLFMGAYGGSYKESKRSGHGEVAANIYALLSAGSEVATEYFLGKLSGLSKGTQFIDVGDEIVNFSSRWQIFQNFLVSTGKDILGEIREEELQNVLDAVFKNMVYGEPIELSGQEMIDTAIITFFTTGLMNAPNNVINFTAQNIKFSKMQQKVSFRTQNGNIVDIPVQELLKFKNNDGSVDLDRLNNYLIEENISHNIEQVVNSTEEQIDNRIETARNRIFETNKGLAFGKNNPASLHTDSDHVYRNTGMPQIQDILECGYIRPREGKIAGGHENEVHWSRGSDNLFYIPSNDNFILETSSKVLQNDQIGAISINDLTAIWQFDESQNKYVNVLDSYINQYQQKHSVLPTGLETISPNFEVLDVEKINTESQLHGLLARGVDPNVMNMSYKGFDFVYKSHDDASILINDIIRNKPSGNILIELDSTIGLTEENVSQLPSNVKIRVLGDYGIENFKGFKSNDSCLSSLNHVTYSIDDMKMILKELKEFDSGINPNWTDIEKAKYAYDYMQNNIRYRAKNQDDQTSNITRPSYYDGLTNLIAKKSTCQGFAHTYKELLTRMRIPCVEISGRLGSVGQHAFNVVTIDGKNIIVDTTRNKFGDFYEDLISHRERIANLPSTILTEQEYRDLIQQKKDKYPGSGFDVSLEHLPEYTFVSNTDLKNNLRGVQEETSILENQSEIEEIETLDESKEQLTKAIDELGETNLENVLGGVTEEIGQDSLEEVNDSLDEQDLQPKKIELPKFNHDTNFWKNVKYATSVENLAYDFLNLDVSEQEIMFKDPVAIALFSMTFDQLESLLNYSGEAYQYINTPIRRGQSLDYWHQNLVNNVNEIIKQSGGLQQEMTLYRGLSLNRMDSSTLLGEIVNRSGSYDITKLYESLKSLTGKSEIESAFSSTTTNEHSRYVRDSEIVLEITAPQGTAALDISPFSANSLEDEVLLATNTKYNYTDVELRSTPDGGQQIVIKATVENFITSTDLNNLLLNKNKTIGESMADVIGNELNRLYSSIVDTDYAEYCKDALRGRLPLDSNGEVYSINDFFNNDDIDFDNYNYRAKKYRQLDSAYEQLKGIKEKAKEMVDTQIQKIEQETLIKAEQEKARVDKLVTEKVEVFNNSLPGWEDFLTTQEKSELLKAMELREKAHDDYLALPVDKRIFGGTIEAQELDLKYKQANEEVINILDSLREKIFHGTNDISLKSRLLNLIYDKTTLYRLVEESKNNPELYQELIRQDEINLEKNKYSDYNTQRWAISEIKTDEGRLKAVKLFDGYPELVTEIIGKLQNPSNEMILQAIKNLYNDSTKLELIAKLKSDIAKYNAIEFLYSSNNILKAALNLKDEFYRFSVLENEINKYGDREYILNSVASEIYNLVISFRNEDLKFKGLEYVQNDQLRQNIINSFSSEFSRYVARKITESNINFQIYEKYGLETASALFKVNDIIKICDEKYHKIGEGIAVLNDVIKNKDHNYVTRDNGARDLAMTLSIKDIQNALNIIQNLQPTFLNNNIDSKINETAYQAFYKVYKKMGMEEAVNQLKKFALTNDSNSVYYKLLNGKLSLDSLKAYIQELETKFNNNPYLSHLASLSDRLFLDTVKNNANGKGVDQGIFKSLLNKKANHQEYARLVQDFSSRYKLDIVDVTKLMAIIDSKYGACTYGSTLTDLILQKFRYNPSAFKEKFGFSLYTTDSSGKTRLNAASLLFDLYYFINSVENGGSLFENGKIITPDGTNEDQIFLEAAGEGINLEAFNMYLRSRGLENEFVEINEHYTLKETTDTPKSTTIMQLIDKCNAENKLLTLSYQFGEKIDGSRFMDLSLIKLTKNPFVRYSEEVDNLDEKITRKIRNFFNLGVKKSNAGGHAVHIVGYNKRGLIINTWGNNYLVEWSNINDKNTWLELTVWDIKRGKI